MSKYPFYLTKLVLALKRLPGIGSKTAERLALNFLDWPEERLKEIGDLIKFLPLNVCSCRTCGALKTKNDSSCCNFCDEKIRNKNFLCIIAFQKDLFSIEESQTYKGMYHVLGELLSPISGKMLDDTILDKLKNRIKTLNPKEIIIAFDSTLEGDTTALFLKKELTPLNLPISRLASGLPLGISLDYVDSGTIGKAFSGRNLY